jgi:hypothetical protein
VPARAAHLLASALLVALAACSAPRERAESPPPSNAPTVAPARAQVAVPPLVDEVERRSFDYFWELGNPENGLVPDRWPTPSFSSIAAVGFGLSAYGVGVERGWITREQALERTLATLRFFDTAPQGEAAAGMSGHRGFFYHFLDMKTGARFKDTELSSVDTTLLLGGVLFSQSYFDRDDPREAEVRALAERIYRRVEWDWMQPRPARIGMGWKPESGMLAYDWNGYNEALLVYVLALGSPTHPVGPEAYAAWTSTYDKAWGNIGVGQDHLTFPPLFGHQYSQVWLDLRGVPDEYMRARGLDYFENSRRATLAQREYAIANPHHWKGYDANVWGLTACDGPIDAKLDYQGESRMFRTYSARGVGREFFFDDGTLAPTAAIGSMPFAPEVVIPALEAMHARYPQAYDRYGFLDSFNPSFDFVGAKLQHGRIVDGVWVDGDYLGIDQGPIVLMIENHRSGFVWDVMRRNAHIQRGLRRAGFSGGWLDQAPAAADIAARAPAAVAVSAAGSPRARAD